MLYDEARKHQSYSAERNNEQASGLIRRWSSEEDDSFGGGTCYTNQAHFNLSQKYNTQVTQLRQSDTSNLDPFTLTTASGTASRIAHQLENDGAITTPYRSNSFGGVASTTSSPLSPSLGLRMAQKRARLELTSLMNWRNTTASSVDGRKAVHLRALDQDGCTYNTQSMTYRKRSAGMSDSGIPIGAASSSYFSGSWTSTNSYSHESSRRPPKLVPPVRSDVFACEGDGLMVEGYRRATVDELQEALFPKHGQCQPLKVSKSWWNAQLHLYGLPVKRSATIAKIQDMLREALREGRMRVPLTLQVLAKTMDAQYHRLNQAEIARRQQQRCHQATTTAPIAAQEAGGETAGGMVVVNSPHVVEDVCRDHDNMHPLLPQHRTSVVEDQQQQVGSIKRKHTMLTPAMQEVMAAAAASSQLASISRVSNPLISQAPASLVKTEVRTPVCNNTGTRNVLSQTPPSALDGHNVAIECDEWNKGNNTLSYPEGDICRLSEYCDRVWVDISAETETRCSTPPHEWEEQSSRKRIKSETGGCSAESISSVSSLSSTHSPSAAARLVPLSPSSSPLNTSSSSLNQSGVAFCVEGNYNSSMCSREDEDHEKILLRVDSVTDFFVNY